MTASPGSLPTWTRISSRRVEGRALLLLLLGGVIFGACTPAQLPSAGPSRNTAGSAPAANPSVATAAGGEWDRVVAEARREGQVTCGCPNIPRIKEFVDQEWEAAFPDIRLDWTPALPPQWSARVETERAAGQYLWDVYFFGPAPETYQMAQKGIFDPLVPALIRDDVNKPEIWGGWDKALLDSQHQYIFAFWRQLGARILYNSLDQIEPGAINGFRDLLDPKYRRKVVWSDPRVGGGGLDYAAFVLATLGEDTLRRLVVDQETVFVSTANEVVEAVVRGTQPIGMGASGQLAPSLRPFQEAGVRMDIRVVIQKNPGSETASFGTAAIFNRPPHPNGAKVFVNWLLSPEIQTKLAQASGQNSRRADVPPADPDSAVQPGMEVIQIQREEVINQYHLPAMRMIREWRPQ